MLIPRYWAKAEQSATAPGGRHFQLRSWGVSPTSRAEAQTDALERLTAWVRRIEGGQSPEHRYAYGRSVLREELLQEILGPAAESIAIVTRNRYGCRVLNATRVLFLDVDLPAQKKSGGLLSFFRAKPTPQAEQTLDRIRQALASVPGASFRLYRTAAGYRVLGTDRLYGPAEPATVALMKAADTDPAFITLCRVQDCFRARLEPKPWRIGLSALAAPFPYRSLEEEASVNAWVVRFEAAAAAAATCQFLESHGPNRVHAEVTPVLALHDHATRCASGLPLA